MDTLQSISTNLANANKAIEIAIHQFKEVERNIGDIGMMKEATDNLDNAIQMLRIANLQANIAAYKKPHKPDLKVVK